MSALLTIIGSTASAQNPLTLEQGTYGSRVIQYKYPADYGNWGALTEGAMPYEESAGSSYNTVSADGKWALQFVNRKRVWRYETRGDYELVEVATGQKRTLGKGLPASSLMFAKFSPDGSKVAYVSRNNIYMEHCNLSDQRPEQLTFDGNDTIVNGTFDWVYEEEFDCRDGFRWSGNGSYIAYWQSNTSGTGWFDIINNVDSIYPTVQHFPYPKAGTENSAVRIGVIDIFGESRKQGNVATLELREPSTTWIPIPGNDGTDRQNYLPRMEFEPGTNTLIIQQMNRAQSTNTLWKCSVANGSVTTPHALITDTDSAWVETNDNIHWLKDKRYFTFTSERDGWRHIYRVSNDGRKWNCITNAALDVVQEVGFDEAHGYIYFIGTPEDKATDRYLYRAKIYGNGKCEQICGAEPGQHSYTFSPDYTFAVETYSTASHVPQFKLWQCNKKDKWQLVRTLEDNAEAQAKWDAMGLSNKEFVKVKSGDLMLDAWIIKPKNFDPNKKYPVIDYVYGEPASATVQNRWERTLFWQYLANEGFVVVSIENRGANSPRGRQWRKCIYGEVGVAASEDQARGIQSLCSMFPWMDATRIGITGWSGGGSQTLNCMFRYPDVFKTGVAIAFVSDQRLYDTIYQERYMNTPQNNPDGYFRGSPINFTEGLRGNLLLIHGTGDDNVHYQNCEMLTNRLISQGKLFYQLSYPMRTHSISEREGTSMHLRSQIVDFFNKNLK